MTGIAISGTQMSKQNRTEAHIKVLLRQTIDGALWGTGGAPASSLFAKSFLKRVERKEQNRNRRKERAINYLIVLLYFKGTSWGLWCPIR